MAPDRFSVCLAFTLSWEGLWSDDPRDPGGATMRGITLGTFRAWRHDPEATKSALRAITDAEVQAIYGALYYQPVRYQDLPIGLDLMVGDMAVNAGVRRSGELLQRALGMNQVDGWIGPATIAAARLATNPVGKLGATQTAFYRSLPGFATFGKGWLNRVDARIAAATGTAPRVAAKATVDDATEALNREALARARAT